jgi:hypothetical protein
VIFRQLVHDDLGCASYLIGDEHAGVAAVVDPRLDIDEYLRAARYLGVRIEHILETHNHTDLQFDDAHMPRAICITARRAGFGSKLAWLADPEQPLILVGPRRRGRPRGSGARRGSWTAQHRRLSRRWDDLMARGQA